jgi:transcriptional regulator with XRE-family HTH domain
MKHPLNEAHDACMLAYEQSRIIRSIGRKAFAHQLHETRKKLNMTVRELGEKIGVTGSLISQIEVNAKSILPREQVEKIVALCAPFHKLEPENINPESFSGERTNCSTDIKDVKGVGINS